MVNAHKWDIFRVIFKHCEWRFKVLPLLCLKSLLLSRLLGTQVGVVLVSGDTTKYLNFRAKIWRTFIRNIFWNLTISCVACLVLTRLILSLILSAHVKTCQSLDAVFFKESKGGKWGIGRNHSKTNTNAIPNKYISLKIYFP